MKWWIVLLALGLVAVSAKARDTDGGTPLYIAPMSIESTVLRNRWDMKPLAYGRNGSISQSFKTWHSISGLD